MKTNIFAATLIAVFALTASAFAQTGMTPSGVVASGYGSGYGYGYHSSTLEEGFFRGLGAAAQGYGEMHYLDSQAAINWEQAKSAAMDNHLKRIDTFFAARKANAENRAAERGPRLTQQELAELAKKQAPAKLTAYQYEPALGKVYWPNALTTGDFALERDAINLAIAERTSMNSGNGTDNQRQIHLNVQRMQETLKSKVAAMDPAEYLAAKKFLTSLDHEGRQVLVATGLAVK
jgi:hypothetical protein